MTDASHWAFSMPFSQNSITCLEKSLLLLSAMFLISAISPTGKRTPLLIVFGFITSNIADCLTLFNNIQQYSKKSVDRLVRLCYTVLNKVKPGGAMKEKLVWRSIKFPVELAEKIGKIAKKERRSFSAQALLFIEDGVEDQNQSA